MKYKRKSNPRNYEEAEAEINSLARAVLTAIHSARAAHVRGDRAAAWAAWRGADMPLKALYNTWIGDTELSREAKAEATQFYRDTGGSSASYLNSSVQPNPVSSRTLAKHAALLAEHRYEDAAKVYKRAMKRKRNPASPYQMARLGSWVEAIGYKQAVELAAPHLSGTMNLDWSTDAREAARIADELRAKGVSQREIDQEYDAAIARGQQRAAKVTARKNPLGGTYIVTYANPRPAPSKNVKLRFSSRTEAWDAMHALDAAGIDAGFPSLGAEQTGPNKGYYTVQVARKNATAARKALGR